MKSASVRDFRYRLAELLEGDVPVLVTRHGRNVAIVYPLRHPANVPMDVRRVIVDSVAHKFAVPVDHDIPSKVIERYKLDVDRTLIRENLRRTPEKRLRALQKMQKVATEVRRAGRSRR